MVSLANDSGEVMYHKDLEIGSNLADADSGLQAVVDALEMSRRRRLPFPILIRGKDKVMYYKTLENGMKFVLTAPKTELQEKSRQLAKTDIRRSCFCNDTYYNYRYSTRIY